MIKTTTKHKIDDDYDDEADDSCNDGDDDDFIYR